MVGLSAWWLGLAPATLEFGVRFPNERNQGKQAHPVLKYRAPHGSHSKSRPSSSGSFPELPEASQELLKASGALFSLVPLVWESNPKLQGGWCKPNHQTIGGSDPNHQGIWSPPRAGFRVPTPQKRINLFFYYGGSRCAPPLQ